MRMDMHALTRRVTAMLHHRSWHPLTQPFATTRDRYQTGTTGSGTGTRIPVSSATTVE